MDHRSSGSQTVRGIRRIAPGLAVLLVALLWFALARNRGVPPASQSAGSPSHAPSSASASQADLEHRRALDRSHEPYRAAIGAPEGSSPCESAYNAREAFESKAAELGLPPPWKTARTRKDFVAECSKRSDEEQRCLVPKYQMGHWNDCTERVERMKRRGDPLVVETADYGPSEP